LISRALLIWVALWLAIAATGASGDWVTLENCRLVPNPANDGDSFHVSADAKEYLFRLYFVDAPETDAANPARLIEQAKHFGISVPQLSKWERQAKNSSRRSWRSHLGWLHEWLMQWVEAIPSVFTRSYRRRKAILASSWLRTALPEFTAEG
jgi:hypothetical protein